MRGDHCAVRVSFGQLGSRGGRVYIKEEPTELAYIDTLVNLKIRLDSVKRMTQIQNTS